MNRRLKAPVPIGASPVEPHRHGSIRSPHSGCEPGVYLEDLLVGDAGIGGQFFMNKTYYSQIIPNTAGANVWDAEMSKINLTQARSTDDRPRFFQVAYYATSYLVNLGATAWTASQLLAAPEVGTTIANLEAFIKNNGCSSAFPGYAEFSDPSGGREEIVDVIGKRTYDVVADGVQVGFYLPTNSYQIDPTGTTDALAGNGAAYDGLVALTTIAARIVGVTGTTTQVNDQRTVSVNVEGGGATTRICFPPSTTAVELYYPTNGDAANLTGEFVMIPNLFPDAAKAYDETVAQFVIPAAGGASGDMRAPNSTGVAITNSGTATFITAVFTLEP